MSDWDEESDTPAAPPAPKVVPKPKGKWGGEDEEDDGPASDWEDSSSEEEEKPKATTAAPPKKKGNIKAKLAEKEAQKAARKAAGEDSDDYDSDAVLDPREKARRDRERTSSSELDSIISFQPRTKEDFQTLSSRIIEFIIKRHQNKPLYASFVEHHVRELAMPLKDVEVRKAASGLTTLANEKQKEQREKASGKKKSKSSSKPALGAAKPSAKLDTELYDEALDDFGTNADDFM
ncbi:hypothetical protein H0H81_008176 [Sphagnurus paluster]|uniref:Eukaryotic translation initiation factor 3 30 kDa subunit n=1 Tax=Sphagnurus paluster TaxID=117069 RepID=A0A9P7FX23_9AGAR|nr:hypothetical protein H0H81_008176 [Sphagnurus paluster]